MKPSVAAISLLACGDLTASALGSWSTRARPPVRPARRKTPRPRARIRLHLQHPDQQALALAAPREHGPASTVRRPFTAGDRPAMLARVSTGCRDVSSVPIDHHWLSRTSTSSSRPLAMMVQAPLRAARLAPAPWSACRPTDRVPGPAAIARARITRLGALDQHGARIGARVGAEQASLWSG